MKKVFITLLIVTLIMSGCAEESGVAQVTLLNETTEESITYDSYTDFDNKRNESSAIRAAKRHPAKISAKEGECVKITFDCFKCDCNINIDVTENYKSVILCSCTTYKHAVYVVVEFE